MTFISLVILGVGLSLMVWRFLYEDPDSWTFEAGLLVWIIGLTTLLVF